MKLIVEVSVQCGYTNLTLVQSCTSGNCGSFVNDFARLVALAAVMNSAASWDARYGSDTAFFYGEEPNDHVKAEEARLPRGAAVLCLAEGEGRNAVFLAKQGHHVTAVDLSSVGVAKTLALAAKHGVKVAAVVGDLATFEIATGAWDGIVSIWAHVPHTLRRSVHRAVVAGLRPGGIYIFESYSPRQLELVSAGTAKGGPGSADLLATLADVTAELNGLEFVVAAELDREVHEGQGHAGRSAVTQVVARKGLTA